MWKKSPLIVFALLVFSTGKVSALPVGNPLDASWLCDGIVCEGNCCIDPCDPCISLCDVWSIRFGFYGDYVFNRHLEVADSFHDANIRDSEIYTNAALGVFNLYNRFDFFFTLGESQIHFATPASAFYRSGTQSNVIHTVDSNWHLSWSVGARLTIWECGCLGIGAETQYFKTAPHLKYVDPQTADTAYLENARVNYWEYQFGVGATYKIAIAGCGTFVVPYVAFKWSEVHFDLGDFRYTIGAGNFELYDLESRRHTGFSLGTTLVGCQKWSFTAEGRFWDEVALSINSQIRF